MLLVVHDSFEASSQNATIEEETARAKLWTDLLYETIPADRLKDSFRRAFRDKRDAFAVNAYDLQNAWERIKLDEAAEHNRDTAKDRTENPVKYCIDRHTHINPEGDVEILLGGPGGTEVIIPCGTCRPTASLTRLSEEKAKYQGTLQPVETIIFDMLKHQKRKLQPKTDIVGDAMRQLGEEITDCRDEFQKERLRDGWLKLVRIAEYVRSNE